MHKTLRYEILEIVILVIVEARPLVAAIQRKDRDLANQLRRALNSIGLNAAEGFGCTAGNGRMRFESAHGSLYEAQAGLGLAIAWSYITSQQTESALALLDRLGKRLYGLARH